MNAKKIIKNYLEENGYDGLYTDGCGCRKHDLFPCDSVPNRCKPGYLKWEKDEFGHLLRLIVGKKT